MSHTLSQVAITAIREAALKVVLTPEFLKSLTRGEFSKLYSLVATIAEEVGIDQPGAENHSSMTSEAQANILREAFGPDGQKRLVSMGLGQDHPESFDAPNLDNTPVATGFPLTRNELGDYVIVLEDDVIRMNALMLFTSHLHSNGIYDGYRLGDAYYFYVEDNTKPESPVMFHNRNTGKRFTANTTLGNLAKWYQVSVETIKNRMQHFSIAAQ